MVGPSYENIEKIFIYRRCSPKSRSFHAITILKTKTYYYYIELLQDHISLQRSIAIKDVLAEKYNLKPRIGAVSREIDWVDGKGSIFDVINYLLENSLIKKKFNFFTRNCQEITAQVFNIFNARELVFKKYRKQRMPRSLGAHTNVFDHIGKALRFSKLLV